jgi:hypothetical protein
VRQGQAIDDNPAETGESPAIAESLSASISRSLRPRTARQPPRTERTAALSPCCNEHTPTAGDFHSCFRGNRRNDHRLERAVSALERAVSALRRMSGG